MATYATLESLVSRFGQYTVDAAATMRGASGITTADPNRVEDALVQVEAKANGILQAAGISVPVTDPRVPVNLREIIERMALNQLRFNSAGGKRSEAEAQEWETLLDSIRAFTDGREVLDGQDAVLVDYILTNNDDGRAPDWSDTKRDVDGNPVNEGLVVPKLDIL